MREANARAHIIKRLGRPEEIASMVACFFREGQFLTGLTPPVDSGWSVRATTDRLGPPRLRPTSVS
jgi:NAD(P)-dependent dehydrogenase (short-subunit alcohol dehydrogenase family)